MRAHTFVVALNKLSVKHVSNMMWRSSWWRWFSSSVQIIRLASGFPISRSSDAVLLVRVVWQFLVIFPLEKVFAYLNPVISSSVAPFLMKWQNFDLKLTDSPLDNSLGALRLMVQYLISFPHYC